MERYSWLIVAASLVAGFVGGLVASRIVPGTVRGERFEAVDEYGRVCARLDKDGLAFYDQVVPGEGKYVARLEFYDKSGESRALVNGAGLALVDERGTARAFYTASHVVFYDHNGRESSRTPSE